MKELIELNLIYGRLLTVSAPYLIERYNKALEAFGLPPTKLDSFQIDMSGHSPQIAEEMDVALYLEQDISRRRFIIVAPEQENLPVIGTRFSNTAALMHVFFEKNRRVIQAATIKDVLFGEIDDNLVEINDITDLLAIEEVTFRVLSSEETLFKAEKLRRRIDRLMTVQSAWRDDEMLQEMVDLARVTGDIRTNDLVPDQLVFRHESYFLDHFGGVYVFKDGKKFTIVCDGKAPGFRRASPWKVDYIDVDDKSAVYDFLARSGRLQLPMTSWLKDSVEHRRLMAMQSLMHETDSTLDIASMTETQFKTWAFKHSSVVDKDPTLVFLHGVERGLADGRPPMVESLRPKEKFMVVRAKPTHPDRWVVSRLISKFVPTDYVSRFVFDKQGFYTTYNAYASTFKDLVVKQLVEGYLEDKKVLRERLYGFT